MSAIIIPGFTAEKSLIPQQLDEEDGGGGTIGRGPKFRTSRNEMSVGCWWRCGKCVWTIVDCGRQCWGRRAYFPCVVDCLADKGEQRCVGCIECVSSG